MRKVSLLFISVIFTIFGTPAQAQISDKELRIVDHQVYLFENGIQSIQLTVNGNVTYSGEYQENMNFHSQYPSEKCTFPEAYSMSICDLIDYQIAYQDQEIAYVVSHRNPVESIGSADFLVFSFKQDQGKLISIVNKLPIAHKHYNYFSVKNNGSITHEIVRRLDIGGYGGNFTRLQRREFNKKGYSRNLRRNEDFPSEVFEEYTKVFTRTDLQALIQKSNFSY